MVIAFSIADFYVFLRVGTEPTALVVAFFGFVTTQLWNTASIKKVELKRGEKNGMDRDCSEVYNTADNCDNCEIPDTNTQRV